MLKTDDVSVCLDNANIVLDEVVTYLEDIYDEVDYYKNRHMIDKIDRLMEWNDHIKTLIGFLGNEHEKN